MGRWATLEDDEHHDSLHVRERETETERGGASHGCQWAGRKEKLHLGSCCQGYRLSSAAAVDVHREARMLHLLGIRRLLETLQMLSWRLDDPLLAG